jgi:hypothetical protein
VLVDVAEEPRKPRRLAPIGGQRVARSAGQQVARVASALAEPVRVLDRDERGASLKTLFGLAVALGETPSEVVRRVEGELKGRSR